MKLYMISFTVSAARNPYTPLFCVAVKYKLWHEGESRKSGTRTTLLCRGASGEADTDATIDYAVLFLREIVATPLSLRIRSNQSTRNVQQYTRRYFPCCPPMRLCCEYKTASKQWYLMACREQSWGLSVGSSEEFYYRELEKCFMG
jgi:hypothetical protein